LRQIKAPSLGEAIFEFMKAAIAHACLGLLVLMLTAPSIGQEPAGRSALNGSGLKLTVPPRILLDEWQKSPAGNLAHLGGLAPGAQQPASIQSLRLFDGSGFGADLRNDGKVHYRLPGPSILGTHLGGQLSTNSARLSLTWPPKN